MFIIRALEKILSDKDIKKSYHSQLKRTCELSLSKWKSTKSFSSCSSIIIMSKYSSCLIWIIVSSDDRCCSLMSWPILAVWLSICHWFTLPLSVSSSMYFADEIQNEIKRVGQTEDSSSSALPLPKDSSTTIIAEQYFQTFEMACQSKSPRIVITALDCLQVR